MTPPLIGHPERLGPFKAFLGVIAKTSEPILLSGPSGSGKKRIIRFLVENGPLNQEPIFFLPALQLSEEIWAGVGTRLNAKGTLVLEGIHHLPLPVQFRLRNWLFGGQALFSEETALPAGWRVIATCPRPEEIWEELLFDFPYHLQIPSLNEVIEDIPFHIKYFLQDKPIRFLRYFFLLKTFFHHWQGNLRELDHYLLQAMAYYQAMALVRGFSGGEEVFGEKHLRFSQDVLKGEWWYYPYRFRPGFTEHLKEILTETDFRSSIIKENWVIPLLKEEPGFLVLDLKDPEFENKAIRIYQSLSRYLALQSH